MTYIIEQLEQAGLFWNTLFQTLVGGDDDGKWNLIGSLAAFGFRLGYEAWRQFTGDLGIDGDYLVRGNYQNVLLGYCEDDICKFSPTPEQLREVLQQHGRTPETLQSAKNLARSWHELFDEVCVECPG